MMDAIFATERLALKVYWTSAGLGGWSVVRWSHGRIAISAWRFVIVYRNEENRIPKELLG